MVLDDPLREDDLDLCLEFRLEIELERDSVPDSRPDSGPVPVLREAEGAAGFIALCSGLSLLLTKSERRQDEMV